MKTIYSATMTDLAPKILKKDKKIILSVIDELLRKHIIDNIKKLVVLDRLDELEKQELDLLADELHVDYYNHEESLQKKRDLIKKTIILHSEKGTPASVKKILETFFMEAELSEWFDYGAEPGFFKIEIFDNNPDLKNAEQLHRMIKSTKRASQHLETINFIKGHESKNHMFSSLHSKRYKTYKFKS